MNTFLGLAAVLLLVSPSVQAAVWVVDPSGGADFETIQAALDGAVSGDEVVLMPGTYRDDVQRVVLGFSGPCSTAAVAHLAPGVAVRSSAGASVTVIDGEGVRRGFVGADLAGSEISGVTFLDCVTNSGYCPELRGGVPNWGGGLLAFRSNLTVRECRFVDCRAVPAGHGGGGGAFLQGGSATVVGNLFLRCQASDLGGGLELYGTEATVAHNTFAACSAERWGSAVVVNDATVALHNNIFVRNAALGGPVACFDAPAVEATCNLTWANTSIWPSDPAQCAGGIEASEVAPLFCDPIHDDFTVRSDSPASPPASGACGAIGAFPVACGTVATEPITWGRVKAAHRGGSP